MFELFHKKINSIISITEEELIKGQYLENCL